MAVFRVERIKDYTVMSNHHLRNKNLSLKAKGLLSQMLSLPDDWDYTLKGLAAINKESVDAIRTAIWELEDTGYVVRTRVRDERGCLRGCDYYVYEYPQTLSSGSGGSAESVPPMLEPLASDSAVQENPIQLNKEIQNKEKQNTDLILSEGEAVRTKVRDNIELDLLCRNQPESAPVMQEIYELVVETIQLRSPVLRLGNNLFPMPLVRERLLQLTSEHIRFVLDGLRNLHTDVKNLKKYLFIVGKEVHIRGRIRVVADHLQRIGQTVFLFQFYHDIRGKRIQLCLQRLRDFIFFVVPNRDGNRAICLRSIIRAARRAAGHQQRYRYTYT